MGSSGINEDGCAPRFSGVNHEKFISTTNHHDDKIANYKTSIVATGQGGFWLRSYKANRYAVVTFSSGNYYIHRDLGNGKTSSATFQFNDDVAAIQSALQTIEGWDGVSVACNSGADSYAKGKGVPGKSGHSASEHGLECYVTYAVGYDDGARLPTMTYDNFNGANIASLTAFQCVNEICASTSATLGTNNFHVGVGNGKTDSQPRFENNNGYVYITAKSGMQQACLFGASFNSATASAVGSTVTQASSGAVGTLGATATSATQTFIVTNGIAFDSAGPIVINGGARPGNPTCAAAVIAKFSTGTYEIIRTTTNALTHMQMMLFAPGQADCATLLLCFNPLNVDATAGQIFDTTPLMPMWPSISNSIALHDTTIRVVLDSGLATATIPSVTTGPVVLNDIIDTKTWNLGYGSLGYTQTMDFMSFATCEDIQAHLAKFKDGGVAGFSTTGTPYPSLVDPNDATKSICDCHKMDTLFQGNFNIMWDITCPAFLANHLWITKESRRILKTQTAVALEYAYVSYTYVRQTPPSGIETKVAVGDTLTVLSSNANTNKQYTVKAFVDDGKWGSGQANIWSKAAGYLGADSAAAGMVHANSVVLNTKMNYRAYGDFVKFLKVEPAPTADYQITEMKTVGQNSTTFTRTLESISTTTYSVAELTFYYTGTGSGDDTGNSNGNLYGDTNVAALSGTFQLMYDGQTTVAMQALVSKEGMMEALASLSNIDHVPTVTGGTATAGAASVTWRITFNAKSGDAKKLTFKYTDTIGNERQESAIVASKADGTVTLSNSVSGQTTGASTTFAVIARNDIVMKYVQEGSTFFDELDVAAATVHDELAAAEVINYYLFQEVGTLGSTAQVITDICKGFTSNALTTASPDVIFEFNGKMSLPIAVCTGTGALSAATAYNTAIRKLTGLETASCVQSHEGAAGTINAAFDLAFPWGANHVGSATFKLACTLPLGVDGASFKVHAMLNQKTGWILGEAANSGALHAGQAYQHRAQNNNGRTFTVTQAYENKISEMTHFSRSPAATGEATNLGSAYGIVAGVVIHNDLVTSAGSLRPGTYYNVKLYPTGTNSVAFAKVEVGADRILSVEIQAGGVMAVLSSAYLIKCDTRIHSALTCTANTAAPATANHHITVTLGDGTTHAKSNILQGSLVIGSTSTAVTGTVAAFCIANAATGSTATTRRNVAASCKATDKDGAAKIDKVILDCDFGGGAVALTT